MHNIENNKIELKESISLVIGNMIGAGIFMLPVSLSVYGSISIIGWAISATMAFILSIIFKRLSSKYPGESGPFHYAEKSFGEFIGFFIVWGYWISILLVNASLAIVVTSYSTIFIENLNKPSFSILFAVTVIILIASINLSGIKKVGKFQYFTTFLKIIPLLLAVIISFFVFDINNFFPINISQETNIEAITVTTALTFFAFLGIESATIPTDKIKNPKETVPKATIIGTVLTIFIYISSSIAIFGILTPNEISMSNAPFADAIGIILGDYGRNIIAIFAIISALGSLNGWTLLQIEIPKNLARKKLFSKLFMELNSRGVPQKGLIISTILVSLLIGINYSKSLSNIFTYLILTSTFCTLVLYFFISLSEILISFYSNEKDKSVYINSLITGVPAFLFCIWMVVGVGIESIISGTLLLSLSLPIYIYQKKYVKS
tara:strand:- start:1087 stop:2391 length:1305 start_codon:yes stop_codon:yes gene_type:complete